MASKTHRQSVVERLRQDPSYAANYINAALEDGDESGFLTALRNIAEARQMTRVAESAEVQRESLYRVLSESGNPRLSSLFGILKALDLRISVANVENLEPSKGTLRKLGQVRKPVPRRVVK